MSRRVRKPRTVYELKPRTIYGLVDPRDELVHYVGMSAKVFRRFKEHVEDMIREPALAAFRSEGEPSVQIRTVK